MSKGFTNLGNTCYMNSALQCLSHLEILNHECNDLIIDCTKRSSKNNYELMSEWIKLQRLMWSESDNGVINTIGLLKEFIRRCQNDNIYFESFQQNDCGDFINTFLDLLHNSIKRKVVVEITGTPKNKYDELKLKSIHSWKKFFENSYSHIIKNFYSELLSITCCPNCKYMTTNHEPIMNITLTMKENYKTIYDCFDEFVREITLDTGEEWKCDKCNEKVRPQKKLTFWELSPILILSIKQYRLDNRLNIDKKIDNHIEYPEVLDLNNYCLNLKNKNLKYKLSGICIHSGSLHGGHYYAMCKDYKENKWRVHNDTSVTDTNLDIVLNQNPYCFFYVLS